MHRIAAICVVAFAVVFAARLDAQDKKYDVKSGIITYETSNLDGRITITGKIVLYFDQFGRMECKDTYVNGMLKESVLCDGRTVYTLWHDQRIVFKRGPATRGTEVRFDLESLPASGQSVSQVRKLSPMIMAGITCEAFERVTPSGSTKYAGADHILMYCERNLKGENWVMKAVSFDKKTNVPAWKFIPPAGYVERESHF